MSNPLLQTWDETMNIMRNLHQCENANRGVANHELAVQPTVYQPGELTDNVHLTGKEIADCSGVAGGPLRDMLAEWSVPQYLLAARKELAALALNSDRLRLLQHMTRDGVALQHGGYWTPRIELDRERLALEREKLKHVMEMDNKNPKKRRNVLAPLTDEERLAIVDKIDEVMGLK